LSGTEREVLGPAKPSPTPPLRPDDGRHLLQQFDGEHGAHLGVTALMP